ncbi:hypothetical protein RHGRI_016727 [Rhododendron griersonianum]|uniref:Angio-associated migratory cell protein n=1 Tax=Rhododendron griersonianum TaxID=479676 RepID=A0AAV6JVL8_9ERIC|nr:hypothetical protein RHGRI_016727 [Rhododendron griersonianum]
MNAPANDEEDHGEVFLDETDALHVITIDDQDLPEADEELDIRDADGEQRSDGESMDEADDSMHIFTGHTVACSPTDGTLVATGSGDDKGFLWRIGEGDWAFQLQGHENSVCSLAFSTDGQLLASGSLDGIVQIWDINSCNLKCTLDGPGGGIEWVRWHPRGHLVLAGSEDSTVWMWNADKSSFLNMFSGHGSSVTCGDFTPDGKTICTGSDDATLRIWNPRSGENIHVVRGHPYHTDGLTCLTITSDSTLALTGSKDSSVHIVNITTGKLAWPTTKHIALGLGSPGAACIKAKNISNITPKQILSTTRLPSSPWAATGGMDQKLIVWDLQHSLPRCTCEHKEGVACLSWLGSSKYVATGCVDGKVRVWDSLSGDCVRIYSGHSDAIQSLAVSANGDFLVSVSIDGTARVFEIAEFQ